MDVPTAYAGGWARARVGDEAGADRYVRHTTVGDPQADALMEALSRFPEVAVSRWLQLGIESGPEALLDAPDELRAFFSDSRLVPEWFHSSKVVAGNRAFFAHSEMILGAFVAAVLIEGFTTLISKSFSITGRLVDQGVRRLQQNNRHLVEIFLPGGLEPGADGWKLSVRIRLMHARVRRLLLASPEWDAAAWGVPLSAAHTALATSLFSALLLRRASALGVIFNQSERDAFMTIWRRSAQLMGVVPELLFRDEAEALRLYEVGMRCEPPPGVESVQLAHALIHSAPIVSGITQPVERQALASVIFKVSRALIGDPLADQLQFPAQSTRGVLWSLRWKYRTVRGLSTLVPGMADRRYSAHFGRLLDVSLYSERGISYQLAQHVHAEQDPVVPR